MEDYRDISQNIYEYVHEEWDAVKLNHFSKKYDLQYDKRYKYWLMRHTDFASITMTKSMQYDRIRTLSWYTGMQNVRRINGITSLKPSNASNNHTHYHSSPRDEKSSPRPLKQLLNGFNKYTKDRYNGD